MLINPLQEAFEGKLPALTAGNSTPTNEVNAAKKDYDLGLMNQCPICSKTMQRMLANDIEVNCCVEHRVVLPIVNNPEQFTETK